MRNDRGERNHTRKMRSDRGERNENKEYKIRKVKQNIINNTKDA